MKEPGLDAALKRELSVEVHKKISIPLSCLLFGLIAVPLGIQSHRSIKSRGFAVGLIIVSVFYLLRIGGEALVEMGYLPAFIGVWTPNIIFAILGIILFYTVYREIPLLQLLKNLFRIN